MIFAGPRPGLAGERNTLFSLNATPGARVWFAYGLKRGTVNVPGCAGLLALIANPQVIGSSVADDRGEARLEVFVPRAAKGRTILFQNVELRNCLHSDVGMATFQ